MKILNIYKKEHERVGYDIKDIEVTEYQEVHAEYNDAGQLVKEERFYPDGSLNMLTLNQYNDQNLLVQTEQFDGEETLLQKSVNTYDDQNRLVQQSNSFVEEDTEDFTKFIYDNEGNLLRQEAYCDGVLENVEKAMEYENGRLIKETEYDEYGTVMYVHTYEYNEQGQVRVHVRNEVKDKDRRTYEFSYDTQGNCVKELVYNYGDKLIAKTYRTYNNDNLLIEVEEEDLDNYRKVTMEYANDRCIKNTVWGRDEVVRGWAEYGYNDEGKEISVIEYIPDEVQPDQFRILRETTFER